MQSAVQNPCISASPAYHELFGSPGTVFTHYETPETSFSHAQLAESPFRLSRVVTHKPQDMDIDHDTYVHDTCIPKEKVPKAISRYDFMTSSEQCAPGGFTLSYTSSFMTQSCLAPSPKTPAGLSVRTPPQLSTSLRLDNLPCFQFQDQFHDLLKAHGGMSLNL